MARNNADDMKRLVEESNLREVDDDGRSCHPRNLLHVLNRFADSTLHEDDIAGLFSELSAVPHRRARKRPAAEPAVPVAPDPIGWAEDDAAVVPLEDAAPNIAERLAKWQRFSETELKMELLMQEDKAAAQHAEMHVAFSEEEKRSKGKGSLAGETQHHNEDLSQLRALVEFRGGKGKHVSRFGGYTLAAGRANAHIGAAVLAQIMAGGEHQGEVKDRHTIYAYEHKMATAKNLRSIATYLELSNVGDLECHEIKSDATHEFAAQISKVHVCKVSSSVANINQCITQATRDHDMALLMDVAREEPLTESPIGSLPPMVANVELEELENCIHSMSQAADLQEVHEGTSTELYNMHMKELASVGCPTWEQRVAEAALPSPPVECSGPTGGGGGGARLCIYSFGLDAGGEHVGFGGRLRTAIAACPTVWFVITFCMMHQASASQFQAFLRKLRDKVT